jgi:hypothetical protein
MESGPPHATKVYRRLTETVAARLNRADWPYSARVHAILICAALALASPTRAPSPDEARLYDEGQRAFQAGDARAAEKAWKEGYAVAHDPAFLVHIGEAQEKAGAPGDAADSYRRYLREAPDAADRADIEQRLARLAPAASPPEAAPANANAPAETPGEFGATPPAPSLVPPGPPAGAAPARGRDEETPKQPTKEESGWNRYNITAVASTAVAIVALGVAGLFAAKSSSDSDDVNRLINYRNMTTGAPLQYSTIADQYQRAMADGPRHERDAKIALVVSSGAAAVAATFFVLDARHQAEPAVSIAPAGHGFAATGGWQWRF